jgi:pyridoxal phosphate enzyme (YggS family)
MESFMEGFDYIKRNYEALTQEISELADRKNKRVNLVAVTKSASDEELLALVKCGATEIGENRPQELARRGKLLEECGFRVALHEIGNLQKNKVRTIIDSVALIHSLDSLPLAHEINRRAEAAHRFVPVLIEINSAREVQKGGVLPEDAEELIKGLSEYPNLLPKGLMTMGPAIEEEGLRPYFRKTKALFDSLCDKGLFASDPVLSMGMSESYRVAIEEGSDIVRVGRRLFIK